MGFVDSTLELALRLFAEFVVIQTLGLIRHLANLPLDLLLERPGRRPQAIGDRPFASLALREPGNESKRHNHGRDRRHRLDHPAQWLFEFLDVEAVTQRNKHQVGDAGDDPADIQKDDESCPEDRDRIRLHHDPE